MVTGIHVPDIGGEDAAEDVSLLRAVVTGKALERSAVGDGGMLDGAARGDGDDALRSQLRLAELGRRSGVRPGIFHQELDIAGGNLHVQGTGDLPVGHGIRKRGGQVPGRRGIAEDKVGAVGRNAETAAEGQVDGRQHA